MKIKEECGGLWIGEHSFYLVDVANVYPDSPAANLE
jgi:hypothetical protein